MSMETFNNVSLELLLQCPSLCQIDSTEYSPEHSSVVPVLAVV